MNQSISDQVQARIDEICVAFEQLWQKGETPCLEEHLSEVEVPVRSGLLPQLIGIDLHYRGLTGEPLSEETYVSRFPEHAEAIHQVFQHYLPVLPSDVGTLPVTTSARTERITLDGVSIPGYEILGEIARGGMGVVYKARHQALDCLVALKVILAGQHSSAEERQRMLREAKAIATLQHPNVIHVFEVGEDNGLPYMALELCSKQTLADRIKENPLPPGEAAKIVETLARAMHVVHERHIIHRDLKPSNVLLTEDGTLKITDFGLAKKLDEAEGLTRTNVVMGTPSYAPPEQLEGKNKELDARGDVYSLGAVLYELLTGRPPFRAATTLDTILQVLCDEPVPPRQLNSLLPLDLETICLKSLVKDPRQRYQSAKDLAEELNRFQNGEPIQARQIGRGARAWRWCKRYPLVASLTATVVLLLIAGTIVSTGFALHSARLAGESARLAGEKEVLANNADRKRQEAEELAGQLAQTVGQKHAATRLAQQNEKKALWNLYVARLFPMTEAWKKREFGQLERMLEESVPQEGEPDFRGWEWYYFQDQCRNASTTLQGSGPYHGAADWCVKTGKIAIATRRGTIDIWDGSTMQIERTLPAQGGWINRLAWSPQGDRIACCLAGYNTLVIQDAVGGKLLHEIASECRAIAWTRDGSRLATGGGDARVKIWNTHDGQPLTTFLPGEDNWNIFDLDWHPDGVRLAVGQRFGKCSIWDTDQQKRIAQLRTTSGDPVYSVDWNPDGTKLAAGMLPEITIWDENHRTETAGPSHAGSVKIMAWSPDGKYLLSCGSDQLVNIYDVAAAEVFRSLRIHNSTVTTALWGPDSKHLLSASSRMRISNLDQLDLVAQPRSANGGRLDDIAWSPQGHEIAYSGSRGVGVINLKRDEVRHFKGSSSTASVCWSPDQKTLASLGYGTPAITWNAETGARLQEWRPSALPIGNNWDIAWDPRNRWVAGLFNEQAFLLNPSTWQQLVHIEGSQGSRCLTTTPDGRYLVMGGGLGIYVWDTATRALRHHIKCGGVHHGLISSPDGRLIAAGRSDLLLFFRSGDGALIHKATGHQSEISGAAWSPDGRRIASASKDGTIKIWDSATGDTLVTFPSDGVRITCLAWSPDGRRLACGRQDGKIQIWGSPNMESVPATATYLETGVLVPPRHEPAVILEPIQRFDGHQSTVKCVTVSPNGLWAATASGWPAGDGTLRLWNMQTGDSIWQVQADQSLAKGAAFTPDNRHVVSGGTEGVLRVWSVSTGGLLREIDVGWNIQDVATLPDGRHVAAAGSGGVGLWELESGNLVRLVGEIPALGRQMDVAVSGDGKRIISADEKGAIRIWDIASGQSILRKTDIADPVESAILNHDGSQAIAGLRNGALAILATHGTAAPRLLRGHQGAIHSVCYSPDYRRVVTASRDKTLRVWDVATGDTIAEYIGHRDWAMSVVFTPDGKQILSGGGGIKTDKGYGPGDDFSLRLWSVP